MMWAWQLQVGLAQDHDYQPSPQRQCGVKSDTSIARDADKHAAQADLLRRKPANFNRSFGCWSPLLSWPLERM
eukprot:10900653-Lingulodinium_polyedra.AAC.1